MNNYENINQDQGSNNGAVSLRDVIMIGIRNWYWFVISVFICMSAAYFISKSVPQTYVAKALILIKSDDKKGGILTESAIFADMGLGGGGNPVEDEVYVLQSSRLMKTVVERLGLDVNYTVKPLLRNVNIYGFTPIDVSFIDKGLSIGSTVKVTNLDNGIYKYHMYDNDEDIQQGDANFGDTVMTSRGRFVVNPTLNYSVQPYLNEPIKVTLYDSQKQAESILGNLNVQSADKNTRVLMMTLKDGNFVRAKDILDMLIVVYNQDVINDKNRVAKNTEKFIIERISAISLDLGGIDGQIERLKKDNNITDFTATSGMLLQSGTKYKEEVIMLETQIALVTFIKNNLSDPSKKNDLIPSNTGISDAGLEAQISRYNEERLRLDKLMDNAGANNPITVELTNNLGLMRANMLRTIDNLLSTLKIKLIQAEEQQGIMDRRIASVPTQEKQVTDVVRQQKIKEELYLYLLNKREENALNLAITESNAKIVENANGSPSPVSPSTMKYLLVAFILGLAIPIVVIFFKNLLDTTVHNKEDIEQRTSIPVLGVLPSKNKSQKGAELIVSETSRDRISEAFRVIRNNMEFMSRKKDGNARIIQFTSTMPGEGKTYVTVNLALSYAHTGKRVLIMDLDLRKGNLTKLMGAKGKRGMSGYLSGKFDDFREIIIKGVSNKNLDFVPMGSIPPNPDNLLMSERLENMIDQLKSEYDYIFLDTVPLGIVADAAIINEHADITVYVMRNGKVDKRYLYDLEKIYKDKKYNNLCILLTDVELRKGYGSYGYGYGYGYGYVDN